MKIGKIPESVLKRSVLKNIKSKHENIKNGAGVGSDCAVFCCNEGFVAQSVQTYVLQEESHIRYAIIKAVNSIVLSGAKPQSLLLSLVLPTEAEEKNLQDVMKAADACAKEYGMQIAGGHTMVADVKEIIATVTVSGTLLSYEDRLALAKPGQDIVVSKWIGLEGTALLAGGNEDKLATRYPLHMIEEAAGFDGYLSITEEAHLARMQGVTALHDVSTGGIFAALWEMAERAGVGLNVDLKKIPVRQETVEVCEFFGISPYELLSGGSLLMAADDGEALVAALAEANIMGTVIGKITDNNDRVVINEDEKRFLERPRTDEITKI